VFKELISLSTCEACGARGHGPRSKSHRPDPTASMVPVGTRRQMERL
jgi:hypothetical protein